MSAMIEMVNGVASFAENGRKERAWHGLGQVVDEPMFVADALKLCHADYNVKLQPVVALSDEILTAIQNGEMIEADKEILYSEIKFFKRIRKNLAVSDEVLYREFPDKEDFFLPDIAQQDYEFVLESEFASIQLSLEEAP